jgi:hypothetical protein
MESDGGVADSRGDTFRVILAAVNADYHELARIPGFELPQLREYMDAVDSPIGPEIEENDLPLQVAQRELPSPCMNPVEVVRKLGRSHGRLRGELSRHR